MFAGTADINTCSNWNKTPKICLYNLHVRCQSYLCLNLPRESLYHLTNVNTVFMFKMTNIDVRIHGRVESEVSACETSEVVFILFQ